MKNKKILFIEICNYIDYPTGGHLSFAKNMLYGFGNDLILVGSTTDEKDPIGKWFEKEIDGVYYNYFAVKRVKKNSKKPIIPGRISSYFWLKKYVKDIFKRDDFDLILIQTPEVLLASKKYLKKKTIIEMPGIENPLFISRYKIGKLLSGFYDNFFFKLVDKDFIFLAAADTQSIKSFVDRSKGKINMDNIKQFPNTFNEKIFSIRDKVEVREILNISLDVTLIVTVGRLNWFKGWKFMIDSFDIYLKEKQNSIFYFIGDGEDELNILNYITELELEEKIKLIGRKEFDELGLYLSAADLFIMGSYKEGWSTSLVEAIASGLPCVVTDFSSARDLVKDYVNGFVLQKRDEIEFSSKMLNALNLSNENLIITAENIKEFSISNLKNMFYSRIEDFI